MEDDSLLNTIKSMLGIEEHDDGFDTDIIIFINTSLSILYQIGVAGSSYITDASDKWNDVFDQSIDLLDFIKTYIYMRVKVMFDPPSSSFVLTALQKEIDELEWRIQVEAEGGEEDGGNVVSVDEYLNPLRCNGNEMGC